VAVARSAKALTPLFSPRTGARISSAPTLRWRPVTRASYYNVQLYRGRDKVLSTWPTQPRLRLRTSWTYLGKRLKLSVGIYRWYVWPGYGKPVTRRYGRLLGQSTFTVTARR
jgi:hypothetical protein